MTKLRSATQVTEGRWYSATPKPPTMILPPLLVLHTIECCGGRMNRNQIAGHAAPPHLWCDPVERDTFQSITLDRAARALLNASGGVQTNNRDGLTIQIEMQLYSDASIATPGRHVSEVSDQGWMWFGAVLADVNEIVRRIDPQGRGFLTGHFPEFRRSQDSYGVRSSTRFSNSEWLNFNGICGHQHVPENSHWDPGPSVPMDLVLSAAGGEEPGDDEDMVLVPRSTLDLLAESCEKGRDQASLAEGVATAIKDRFVGLLDTVDRV